MAQHSDEYLFSRGTQFAMSRLVGRYEQPLFRFLHRLCGDRHLAEDLFQETFLRLFRSRARFDFRRRLKPYLYRIALNAFRDARRKKSPVSTPDGDEVASGNPGPPETAERGEAKRRVRDAIAALPEHEREVVLLRVFEGLSFREVAEALGVKLATAKSRMRYALQRLRPVLEGAIDS